MMKDSEAISNDLQARALAEQAVRVLSEQSAEAAANKVAEKVVAGIFLHLGVNVNDPEAMATLRDNLSFLARLDRGAREVKSAAIKTCVGAIVSGLIALIVFGFKDYFYNH